MRFLRLPTRFPNPEMMGQGGINVWTKWVCEETDVMMSQLEEELEAQGGPDDPFNGTGVLQPVQENLFSLPPLVQTPRRQGNPSKHNKPLQDLPRNSQKPEMVNANMNQNQENPPTQGTLCQHSEHLIDLMNSMRSIRNLHIQQ